MVQTEWLSTDGTGWEISPIFAHQNAAKQTVRRPRKCNGKALKPSGFKAFPLAGAEGLEVALQPLLRCPKSAGAPVGAADFDRCANPCSLCPSPAAVASVARHAVFCPLVLLFQKIKLVGRFFLCICCMALIDRGLLFCVFDRHIIPPDNIFQIHHSTLFHTVQPFPRQFVPLLFKKLLQNRLYILSVYSDGKSP